MRLNRPLFAKQKCESAELYIDDVASAINTSDAGIRRNLDGISLPLLLLNQTETEQVQESLDILQPNVGGVGELLNFPQSFGVTYLGEIFSAHINLLNESNQTCYNIDLKILLHNNTEWINLPLQTTLSHSNPESSNLNRDRLTDLAPGQSLNVVINHELKELGMYAMKCVASYHIPNRNLKQGHSALEVGNKLEPALFQKMYKFPVVKPLDVRKKFILIESDKSLLMETQLQNLTMTPIILETVLFEPSPQFSVIDLNEKLNSFQKYSTNPNSIHLRPNNVQQFLYRLIPIEQSVQPTTTTTTTPPQPQTHLPINPGTVTSSISVGRLDITWRSVMGERGRLQTSALKYEPSVTSDVKLKPVHLPSKIFAHQPFVFTCQITNCSKEHLDLLLDLRSYGDQTTVTTATQVDKDNYQDSTTLSNPETEVGMASLIWLGQTRRKLGLLLSGQSMNLDLQLMPTTSGIHSISGLILHDYSTYKNYAFDQVAQIYVINS